MSKLQQLAAKASEAVGVAVELTIRGERAFTLSADGDVVAKIVAWLKKAPNLKTVDAEYDAELDTSFVFFTA